MKTLVILHISELGTLINNGQVIIALSRLNRSYEDNSLKQVLESNGFLKYNEPESYLVCELINEFQDFAKINKFGQIILNVEMISRLIPLTQTAKILLKPTTERFYLKIEEPIWELDWKIYVDELILQERYMAAIRFANFFNSQILSSSKWVPVKGLYESISKDLGSGRSQIEKSFDSAELGVLEFCIRLASSNDHPWKDTNENYLHLRDVRKKYLSNKKFNEISFIDIPEVCLALQYFEKDVIEKAGYSPYALCTFYEFYRRYSTNQKLNLFEVKVAADKLINYGLKQDAFDFLHLLGYGVGIEHVTLLRYEHFTEHFLVINFPSRKNLSASNLKLEVPSDVISPFNINLNDIDHSSDNQINPKAAELSIDKILPFENSSTPKSELSNSFNQSDISQNIPSEDLTPFSEVKSITKSSKSEPSKGKDLKSKK